MQKLEYYHNAWGSSKIFHIINNEKSKRDKLILVKDKRILEIVISELQLFNNGYEILPFQEYSQSPFELARPLPEITSSRINTLIKLTDPNIKKITVATPYSVLKSVTNKADLLQSILKINLNDNLTFESLNNYMDTLGYVRVEFVSNFGEYIVRGDILDIYPINEEFPIRIEFFDDIVERIYHYDIDEQRAKDELQNIDIFPASELIISTTDFINTLKNEKQSERASSFGKFAGFHWFSPITKIKQDTIFDYLSKEVEVIFLDNSFYDELKIFYATVEENLYDNDERFLKNFIKAEDVKSKITLYDSRYITDISTKAESIPLDIRGIASKFTYDKSNIYASLTNAMLVFSSFIKDNYKIIISMESEKFNKILKEFTRDYNLTLHDIFSITEAKLSQLNIFRSRISGGFIDEKSKLLLVTDIDIFGFAKHKTKKQKKNVFNTTLADLEEGDYVVHINHGIGVYRGIKHLTIASVEGDFLDILYDGNDVLYIPLHAINMVQKYVGIGDEKPKISSLKTSAWQKLKKHAKQSAKTIAEDLLKLYAERKAKKGFAFIDDGAIVREFEESFIYDETEDQLSAIYDTYKDMEDVIPMERLICGDVGFGKTEVAMRAACKSVVSGKQVAVLVPTTILARQHYSTFINRFASIPVKIDFVSRMRTATDVKNIYRKVADGEIDILIGTHKILSKDLIFKDLGLLVIDEEQRFGVNHKEKIAAIKRDVDTLTLSATPIPRTLQLSLSGIRDMSIIETPPEDRLPVIVSIISEDEDIKNAILEELKRGGQVFYLHNKIKNIFEVMDRVRRLTPHAKIAIAHGQMHPSELEDILQSFYDGGIDILISTTIIENGIDIPNVNTIIINNASQFGLSQLYQLKGRVGRSKRRGHCFLVVNNFDSLTDLARKRLTIIEQLSDLGSGFKIAMYDLQLRGAGDILGADQSGFVVKIGYELYVKMIEEAVNTLKGGGLDIDECEINSAIPYFIPAIYIDNPKLRFDYYRRFSLASSTEDMNLLISEIENIYGELPVELINLAYIMLIKNLASANSVIKLNIGSKSVTITLSKDSRINYEDFIQILTDSGCRYKFTSEYTVMIIFEGENTLIAASDIFIRLNMKNMVF